MDHERFESQVGTPEQVGVFFDLQKMIVKLYAAWPGDSAIAVFAAAVGSITALLELEYKAHAETCADCRDNEGYVIDLCSIARENFQMYYDRTYQQSLRDQIEARKIVEQFFGKMERKRRGLE